MEFEIMGNRLYVGNLSWNTDEDSLREAFQGFGTVREAKIIMDRDTGRSRGFGFVAFENEADAQAAISGMDGTSLDGRSLRVREAEDRGRSGGGGGGFGGGGGGGDRRPPRRDYDNAPPVTTRGRPSRDDGDDDRGGSRPPRRPGKW